MSDEISIELLRDAIARLHEDQTQFRDSIERRLDKQAGDINGIATRFAARLEKLEEWHIEDSAETKMKLAAKEEAQEEEGRAHARSLRRISRLATGAAALSAFAAVFAAFH